MRSHLALFLFLFTSSVTFGQENSELIKFLKIEFPQNSSEDGRWVFYENEAVITKIESPTVTDILPGIRFYSVELTNYLGYHKNKSKCLVLFNQEKSEIELVEPIWYSGIDRKFLKKFKGLKFENKSELIKFCTELQNLMLIGSNYKIDNVKIEESKMAFDLVYEGRSNKKVWRQIEFKFNRLKITGFSSTNPSMKKTIKVR
jgi:hypothetical protein